MQINEGDDDFHRFDGEEREEEVDDGRVVSYHPYVFNPADKFRNNDKLSADEAKELADDIVHQASTLKPLDEPENYKTPKFRVMDPEVDESFFAGR